MKRAAMKSFPATAATLAVSKRKSPIPRVSSVPVTDEQAIQQMVEDNVNNRDISTMELAKA